MPQPNSEKVEWHGARIGALDWSEQSRSIAMHLHGKVDAGEEADQIYVIANAFWEPLTFELPLLLGHGWYLFVDTMREPPLDILTLDHEERLRDRKSYALGPRSAVVLIAKQRVVSRHQRAPPALVRLHHPLSCSDAYPAKSRALVIVITASGWGRG